MPGILLCCGETTNPDEANAPFEQEPDGREYHTDTVREQVAPREVAVWRQTLREFDQHANAERSTKDEGTANQWPITVVDCRIREREREPSVRNEVELLVPEWLFRWRTRWGSEERKIADHAEHHTECEEPNRSRKERNRDSARGHDVGTGTVEPLVTADSETVVVRLFT